MPFLFYFDPQGRFGKSEKKPMPRDNKVVTIEGCITDVTWGSDPDSPIQRFHIDVVSIAFVGDVGKASDSAVLLNTLDPSTRELPYHSAVYRIDLTYFLSNTSQRCREIPVQREATCCPVGFSAVNSHCTSSSDSNDRSPFPCSVASRPSSSYCRARNVQPRS
jgi:hypothetical protein